MQVKGRTAAKAPAAPLGQSEGAYADNQEA